MIQKFKSITLLYICFLAVLNAKSQTNVNNNPHVFIGTIFDSTTLISEQYGLMEYLKSNPVTPNTTFEYAITPKNKDYYLKGIIADLRTRIYFYKYNKPIDTLTLVYKQKNIPKIYLLIRSKLASVLKQENTLNNLNFSQKYSSKIINNRALKYSNKYAYNYLPVNYYNTIPEVEGVKNLAWQMGINTFPDHEIKYLKNDLDLIAQMAKAYYNKPNEDLYFFKGSDVPYQAQEASKNNIFPVYRRPGLALCYIAAADTLRHTNKILSLMCYKSAIACIDKALCSNYQKYKMKYYVYNHLQGLMLEMNYKLTSALCELTKLAIKDYLEDIKTKENQDAYVKLMVASSDNMQKIESSAREMRTNRALIFVGSGLEMAGGIAGAATGTPGAGANNINDAGNALNIYFNNENTMSDALNEFAKRNDIVDLKDINKIEFEAVLENCPYGKELFRLIQLNYLSAKVTSRLQEFLAAHPDVKFSKSLSEYNMDPANTNKFESMMIRFTQSFLTDAFRELK